MSNSQEELMVQVAWMYYEDGLTHQAIAEKLNKSRVSITRLLQRARAEGVIQVRILKPLPYRLKLERRIQEEYGLEDVHIIESHSDFEQTLEDIGMAGVEHLLSVLRPGVRLGFGWSTTLSRMAAYLQAPKKQVECKINDMAGSMLGQVNPYSISSKVAEILAVHYEPLSTPVILQSRAARDALLTEPMVRNAFENARKCDVAFMGLGEAEPEGTIVRTGHLTSEQMQAIQQQGAVGDILLRFFDTEGRRVPTSLDERVMSIQWDDIRRIPHVVILAAGESKIPAIRGMLKADICHCLITDTDTAKNLLEK